MTFLTLTLLLGNTLPSVQALPEQTTDSISLKELTVYSIATDKLSLPYVAINKKEIESSEFITPADALRNQTGLWVARDGVWATSVNVRGISEQRILLLSNEDRIQSATDVAGAISTVDMNSLEKIEVIKGAGSVLYGNGAMGAVVNFVGERPGYSDIYKTSGKISTGFHTVNQLWTNAANINFTNKNWYIALNGSYRTAQNMMTPKGELNNSQFNDASWGLKGGMKYGENQELLVAYNHFEAWNAGIPGNNSFPKTATARYSAIQRNQLSGEYIFKNISNLVKDLKIKAYTQNISRDVELKPNATNLTLPASLNTTTGVKALANLYFNDYNTLTAGVETWVRNSETGRMKINTSNDTTVIGEIPTPKSKMYDAGVFGLYKKIIDPNHLLLNAGLRFDYSAIQNDTLFNRVFNYKIINGERLDIPFTKSIIFDSGTAQNLSYSAHIDLEYSPVKGQKIIFSIANSYRVASMEERFKYIDLGNGIHKGNPNLKPENGWFSNLRYAISKNKFAFKTELFANYLYNLITEEKTSSISNVYENKNIDKALFAGIEMELNMLINRNIKLYTNASYVYTRNINTGNPLPLIPPAHGIAGLDYYAGKKLGHSLEMEWALAQNDIAPGEVATDGHLVFNYKLHTKPVQLKNGYLQLFSGIDNILNTAYKNHLFNNRGLDFYEPGRNLFVKLKWGW